MKVAMYTIGGEFIAEYKSLREACRKNDFPSPGSISNVIRGRTETAYGYKWRAI